MIGERKVPLFIRFIVEIPLLVTVYSNFTGATLWGTVLLWQANGKPPASGITRQLCREQFSVKGPDAPTTAREWNLPFHGALTLFFRWRKKSVQKKASGTATPEVARPASRYSQISAFRALPCPALVFAQACQSLTAYGSCAHWARAPSRPTLLSAGTERLDDPNKFGSSNSGLRAGTV